MPQTDGTLKQTPPAATAAPDEQPAAKVNLVEAAPAEAQETPAPTTTPAQVQTPPSVVGVGVSVDSTKGTQVYKYSQGADGQVLERTVRTGPTAPGTISGIGVSVDSEKGTQVYRYQGTPALAPIQ